jgi:hypothetical protein
MIAGLTFAVGAAFGALLAVYPCARAAAPTTS